MSELIYKIEFYSNWHTGSGLAAGNDLDMVVIKDENGLPYIPGKTLKGLLREAAESIFEINPEFVSNGFIENVFGERVEEGQKGYAGHEYKFSECFFSNAEFDEKIYNQLKDKGDLKKQLFDKKASTEINKDGVAEDHSLRSFETVIPVVLYAKVEGVKDNYLNEFEYCLKYVKRIGLNRNKGLGRCKLSILKN